MILALQMWGTLTIVVFGLMLVAMVAGETFIDRVLGLLFPAWVLASVIMCLWAVWS